ncbi:MAG: alpha/beta fold hydrolase, partial [Planctomycetales bacterium]|nr:alpha/beta fold hydrolase [Planctomycetales bacterium]
MASNSYKPELVVLIHGIGSTKWFMWPLARRIERAGYVTRLYTYFTLWGSNRRNGQVFAAELRSLAASGRYARIHVVAHSMGSIVTRCALEEELPVEFGRVVMIGPPNRGSHMARRLEPIYGRISPTLMELKDTPDSFVNQLPGVPEPYEVGVLAASRDRMIEHSNTHVEGQRDHHTVRGMHTASLWTPACAEQVVHFLQTGEFLKDAATGKLPPIQEVEAAR